MFPVLPARESLLIIGLMFVVVMTSIGVIQPAWGKARAVRLLVFLAFAGMLGGKERPKAAKAQRTALASSPSRLYTTSGFGHWFSFRLGCPTEMPLIVLEGAPRPVSSATRPV